jgi:hypothetical protein
MKALNTFERIERFWKKVTARPPRVKNTSLACDNRVCALRKI